MSNKYDLDNDLKFEALAEAGNDIGKFDTWFRMHYSLEDRMTNPGLRSDMLAAWTDGFSAGFIRKSEDIM